MDERDLKPLDFVETKLGSFAIIKEVSNTQGRLKYSIDFIKKVDSMDYNAWHDRGDLLYLNNLPNILTMNLLHPFGNGKELAKTFYK